MPMKSDMVINLATVGVYIVSYILCTLYGKPPIMWLMEFNRVLWFLDNNPVRLAFSMANGWSFIFPTCCEGLMAIWLSFGYLVSSSSFYHPFNVLWFCGYLVIDSPLLWPFGRGL